ncbi:gamma-glutamyl hydrolase-like [Amphiura filiformis]|uniref:gamma-glutamyl hydrolase-like n=1 Tax=Amphiura filiformis TaxID=82378 RepID=UPI003B2289B3
MFVTIFKESGTSKLTVSIFFIALTVCLCFLSYKLRLRSEDYLCFFDESNTCKLFSRLELSPSKLKRSRSSPNDSQLKLNERPIIGILTQTREDAQTNQSGTPNQADLEVRYVKWVESAGARVVPVLINQTELYYDKFYESINGVLIPGGVQNEHTILRSPIGKVSDYFYQRSIKEFDQNDDYFPIWGTCQGLELLSQLTAGKDLLANTFNTTEINLPLVLHKDYRTSRLFSPDNMPSGILQTLVLKNITANRHNWSMTTKNFSSNAQLTKFYRILSTNFDDKGVEFISTMEAYEYPIYATQWHPEANQFVWVTSRTVPHSLEAVRASQQMANFFVNEARKNQHKFESKEEESSQLIYNYSPVVLGDVSEGNQIYIFQV